jgi:hypothetical protein
MTRILSKLVRGALLVGAVSVASGWGGAALAAPPERPAAGVRDQAGPNRVRVEVKVVLATAGGQMDPRLQDIARELRSNFEQFQGFQLQSSHADAIGPNQSTSFAFDGGRRATITLLSREDTRARVRIELFNRANERQLDTTVWVPKGKMFPVGVKSQEGRLLLPVTVDF